MIRIVRSSITVPRLLGVALFCAYFVVTNAIFGYVSPSMIFVGLPCPACGLTRSGLLFFSGNFIESFRVHPLFIPTLAWVVGAVLCKQLWQDKLVHIKNLGLLLLVLSIVVYIIRMVLLFPHSPPMTVNSDSILHNLINFTREMTK